MKKVILFLLVVIVGVGIYFSLDTEVAHKKITLNSVEVLDSELEEDVLIDTLDEEKEENLSVEDIDKDLESEENNLIPKEVEPEMVAEVKDLMTETSMEEVEKNFASKQGITPVIAVDIPQNSIATLNIGDTVSLPYMGSAQFDAKIASKKTHANGSVTVTGNLVDNKEFSVVLTEGKNMSFGTVTTPNGSFEIETKDGQGYVYATDDIDQEWIDYGQSDTLNPEENHNNHDHH